MFSYCENNPVLGVDQNGEFLDTVFDAVSLCTSIVKAVKNPSDASAWVEVGLNAACFVLPCVTGLGAAYKAVNSAKHANDAVKIRKARHFTDEAKQLVKSLDRSSGYTKSSVAMGQKIHKGYRVTGGVGKEYGKIKGMRPDYVNFNRHIIYELKPNNPRAIKAGINQLKRYNKGLGGGYKMILEVY